MYRSKLPIFLARSYSAKPKTQFIESLVSSTTGIDLTHIDAVLEASPELTNYTPDSWQRIYDLLQADGMPKENFLKILVKYPSILSQPPQITLASLECWRSCQFGDRKVHLLISQHPNFLSITNQRLISQRTAYIHSYMNSLTNVWRLFMNCPNLVTDNTNEIDQKFKFLIEEMRIEPPEIAKSCALSHSLDKIKCRYVFLDRCGLFKKRSLKVETNRKNSKNPSLYEITDTSDKRFATKVAFVTLEEFEVFEQLFKRELDREVDTEDDQDESEDEVD